MTLEELTALEKEWQPKYPMPAMEHEHPDSQQ